MISGLQERPYQAIETESMVIFEATTAHHLTARKIADLAIGTWSNQHDEQIGGQTTKVQFLDTEARQGFVQALDENAPDYVRNAHGLWVTAHGQGLHYWLSRRLHIAQDIESGSFFDRRFTLGGLSLNRMALTKDYEERS